MALVSLWAIVSHKRVNGKTYHMKFATIFRDKVIGPVLMDMGLYSAAAVNLLLGTALHESAVFRYHHQDGGPAMGLYQHEPNTLKDLFNHYLIGPDPSHPWKPDRLAQLERYSEMGLSVTNQWNLYNARYATAACRLQYYRVSEALPPADDLGKLAAYWKTYWNTSAGAGKKQQFVDAMEKYA